MYQSLICRREGRCSHLTAAGGLIKGIDQPRSLAAARDAKGADRTSDTLIDGMTGDAELRGNLLGVEVTIDKAKHFKLTAAQLCAAIMGRLSGPA